MTTQPFLAMRALRRLLISALMLGSLTALANPAEGADPAGPIEAALAKENWDLAKSTIDAGLAEHPNDVRLLLLKGVWLGKTGDLTAAKQLFQEMVQRFPELSEPYNNLGIVLAQMGDLDGARAQFNKSVLADPSNQAAQNNLKRATSAVNP